MPWKNERVGCYWVLRTVTASFELHSYLLSQFPKPNDIKDYGDRLIYLSCNNYLTFHVFKTCFNEIMTQSLHVTTKRRRASGLVLLAYLEEIRVMCFSGTEFLCMQIMLLFHGRESTSHNIIKYYYFIKIFLRVRAIRLLFLGIVQLCPLTAG